MPQIPFQVSERSIPGATGSPFMPTSDPVGAALQQGGLQIEHAANQFQALQVHQENLRNAVDAEKLVYDYKDKTGKIAEALKTDPTMDENKVQGLIDETLSSYQTNTKPDVWNMAEKHILNESHNLITTTRVKQTERLINDAKALTDRKLFDGIRDAALATTPEERTQITDQMKLTVSAMVQNGVYNAHDGQLIIDHLDEQVATEYFTKLGASNPTQALAELNDTSKTGIAYQLNPNKRNELVAHFGKEAKAQEVTRLLVDLEVKHAITNDPVKNLVSALNEAESTEFLQANGVEKQTAVMNNITNKLRRQQQEIAINDDNAIGQLNQQMVANKLTDRDIMKSGLSPKGQGIMMRSLRSYVSEQRAEARSTSQESRLNRQESRIVKQEKSDAISGTILSQIINGGDIAITDIIAKQQEGLLPADANKLITNYNQVRNNPDLKAAYKVVDDKFSKVDPVKASQMKSDIYRANIEEGLKGTELVQRATTMIDGAKSNKVKELLINVWDTVSKIKSPGEMLDDRRNKLKTTTSQPSQTDLEYTAKQHNMTVDQVKKKLGI